MFTPLFAALHHGGLVEDFLLYGVVAYLTVMLLLALVKRYQIRKRKQTRARQLAQLNLASPSPLPATVTPPSETLPKV